MLGKERVKTLFLLMYRDIERKDMKGADEYFV